MTLYDLVQDFDDIATDRKIAALEKLFESLSDKATDDDIELLYEIFELAAQYESDDYFGTEGLNV